MGMTCSMPRAWLVTSCLAAAVFLTGCGPSGPRTYPVSGTITFNGQPMPDGYVIFTPQSGGQAVTAEIADGKFLLSAEAGRHRVEIEASRFVGPENPIMGLRPRQQYVPQRYNIESQLDALVQPDGENRFSFDLTDEPAN